MPAGSANNGLYCNLTEVSHQGTSGGFKVLRYTDQHGHACAFYDTALLFPTNAINVPGPSLGVAVLDMSDPAHPVQTATLTQLPMESPHESLNLNVKRGLLAAVNGNPSTEPGLVSLYDAHADCRHPILDSTSLVARFGHESGFSSDGRTFYATATALPSITAIDVTDPKQPHAIWQGNILSHGMSLSDDGNRAYIADPTGGDMLILDTSQIQARKPNPQAREISRLTWTSASIPQNAIPFTENGHPYVLEFDEYTAGTLNPAASRDAVGAARIIDISNEAKPYVVANLRLQVDQPADHHAGGGDPGTFSPVQGYAAHYCNIPTGPTASGRLAGRSLGPVTLGMTRTRARRAFVHSSRHGRRNMDFFCLTPIGIRVAYPSQGLLQTLPGGAPARVREGGVETPGGLSRRGSNNLARPCALSCSPGSTRP